LRGINGALDHALRTKLTDQEKEELLVYMENHIPEERMAQTGAEESSR
jgi:hypothetical protein